jgi:uncharacterized membrane protein YeaQ/YmgE (transglycosylase-associated protein family)
VFGFLAGLLATALVMAGLLLAAGAVLYLLGLLLVGLVVGVLGGVVVPGVNHTGVGTTLLLGIGGSVLGGFVGWFAFAEGSRLLGFTLSVAGAAFVVWLVQREDTARWS